jgi:hypothetical protein
VEPSRHRGETETTEVTVIRTIRATCSTAALGAVALFAALAGAGPPAHAGTRPPAPATSCVPQRWVPAFFYQFASNPGGLPTNGSGYPVIGWWQVSNIPFTGNTSWQSLGSNGVNLSITPSNDPPDQGWATSGVVVPLGTVNSSGLLNGGGLNALPYRGSVSSGGFVADYIFDTNGDQKLFDLSGGTTGLLQGYGTYPGDTLASAAAPISPAALTADENPTEGGNTPIWAWISIASGSVGTNTTGYVSSVNGKQLTELVAAPLQHLTATANYTNLTANWTASCDATYKVTVTTHSGSVTVASATVTGTSYHLGDLEENTLYTVHVLAEPAAPGQQPATVRVTTK